MRRFLASFFLLSASLALAEAVPEVPSFNYDVRPILSDRCYFCHGTDPANRKSGLRLDTFAGATEILESGLAAIVPGDATKSELLKRIHSTDPDEVMPPPKSKISLTDREKTILTRWIVQGAKYEQHWAFTPPVAHAPDGKEGSAAIDAFIGKRLATAGLTAAPPTSRERLLRRLSFDLTGLPPSVAEIENFLADASPEATNKVVASLLASPAYGERMAQDWLDVARFADTFGYQADATMHTWPWRDWVIHSFNANQSFDQFITWQLAGDLLPDATREQKIATAFNRLHRQTNEGGSVNEEFRVEYVGDRVQTFGLAFLGLTLECAKCHDHKYDPVTAKDYYSLFAFFNNIDESGLYSHFTDATPTPTLPMIDAAQQAQRDTLAKEIEAAEKKLADTVKQEETALKKWREAGGKIDLSKELIGHFPFDKAGAGTTPNLVDAQQPAKLLEAPSFAEGKLGKALQLSGENNASFATGGNWTRDDAFSFALWMQPTVDMERAVILHRSKAWTDAASCGYELILENGCLSAALIHFWPGNAVRVVALHKLPLNVWSHVVFSYDGSSTAAGIQLFVDGQLQRVEVVRDALTKDINRGGEERVTIGQRFRDRGFKNGKVDELRVYERQLGAAEAALLAGRTPEANTDQTFYLTTKSEPWKIAAAELKALRHKRSGLVDKAAELMVMNELPQAKPAFVLKRGSYEMQGEPVSADVPNAVMPMDTSLPKNRLGLAKWLVDPKHPLTSRVLVNRFWQSLFGRGLVATPEDFGLQGALPSHPELLDYLAVRFRESGWDVKQLLTDIVLSKTYQQDSAATLQVRELDPENKLLARGPRMKLSVEQIRDRALFSSNQLDRTIGGPSIDPEKTSRRTLYTFWKRTMPDVSMDIFDMAKREVCVARRQVTNTPLQALTLLNEPRYRDAAAKAAKLASESGKGDVAQTIVQLCLRMLGRHPSPREAELLASHYREQGNSFVEVASLLMNHDEFVMK